MLHILVFVDPVPLILFFAYRTHQLLSMSPFQFKPCMSATAESTLSPLPDFNGCT